MMKLNYEKDIKIDESALDVEWLEQPRLLMHYAYNVAEVRKKFDLAKEKLDLIRAELDKEIRSNPEKFGIEKLTETVVANQIIMQNEYQEANQEMIQAKYDLEIAQAALRAMDQRKDALENLVKLFGLQYFAGPKVPRDLSSEWKQRERQKQIDSTIRIRRGKEE